MRRTLAVTTATGTALILLGTAIRVGAPWSSAVIAGLGITWATLTLTQKGGLMATPVDLDKLRSLAVIGRRTRPQVREWRGGDGIRRQAITDEHGNTQTFHARSTEGRDTERVDVHIAAPTVRVNLGTTTGGPHAGR